MTIEIIHNIRILTDEEVAVLLADLKAEVAA